MRWIEISAGYACNCRCPGCYSCDASPSSQMDWPEILRWLQFGRAKGASRLWLGGGEPTLRRDFLKTIRAARKLGYRRIKAQSNGMLLSYPQMVDKATGDGLDTVSFLLKSLDSGLHDELNGAVGSHALLCQAIALTAATPLRLEGDILMTSRNHAELPELVRHYCDRGLVHFNIWLFSLADTRDPALTGLVPFLPEAMPNVVRAREIATSVGATFCTLHTPHCFMPPSHWAGQFNVVGTAMWIANPGDRGFLLEDSPIEAASYLPACDGCAVRGPCRGVRPEYVALRGSQGVRAVTAEEAAGHNPAGQVL